MTQQYWGFDFNTKVLNKINKSHFIVKSQKRKSVWQYYGDALSDIKQKIEEKMLPWPAASAMYNNSTGLLSEVDGRYTLQKQWDSSFFFPQQSYLQWVLSWLKKPTAPQSSLNFGHICWHVQPNILIAWLQNSWLWSQSRSVFTYSPSSNSPSWNTQMTPRPCRRYCSRMNSRKVTTKREILLQLVSETFSL